MLGLWAEAWRETGGQNSVPLLHIWNHSLSIGLVLFHFSSLGLKNVPVTFFYKRTTTTNAVPGFLCEKLQSVTLTFSCPLWNKHYFQHRFGVAREAALLALPGRPPFWRCQGGRPFGVAREAALLALPGRQLFFYVAHFASFCNLLMY
jgi:hypothetical protein